MKTLVVYNGGAAGDLVSAMLDHRGAYITDDGRVRHNPNREGLKKPHVLDTDLKKDMYVKKAFDHYDSLPSHSIQYHIAMHHKFIGIITKTKSTAQWAADRFRKLHSESVWQEMQHSTGIIDTDGYAQMMLDFSNLVALNTTNVLLLEDILKGHAVQVLESITGEPLSEIGKQFYKQWLQYNKQ